MALTPDDLANSLDAASDLSQQAAKRSADLAKSMGVAASEAARIGARHGGIIQTLLGFLVAALTLVVGIAESIVIIFLSVITSVRQTTADSLTTLASAVLGEFLATDITLPNRQTGTGGGTNQANHDSTIEAAKVIGEALYARFIKEFAPTNGPVTPDSGEEAAKIFSGYAVNFGAQNAIFSTIADALSFHEFENIREIGEEVAKNLGIGRLQRMALGTLLQATIQKPYTLQLAKRYRPNRAAIGDCVKAFNAGLIQLDDLNLRLAEAGFPDGDIGITQAMAGAHTSAGDAERLQRWGGLTQQAAQQKIQQAGIDSLTALEMLTAAQAARADGEVASYADQVGTYYATQKLDEDKFDELMAPLPMTDDEKHYRKLLYGLKRELDESQLTWAEVEKGFINGIVDEDYVERWLASKGFSAEDSMNKLFLLALDSKAASDKAAAAEAKAKAAKAKLAAKNTP